jgi:DNA-binding transcriptional ArsR family regulator
MSDDPLDPVFKALASSVRRKIIDLLASGPLTTGDLAAAFPEHSRYAVMQHLGVLEKAQLVTVERVGRRRFNHFNPVPIQRISDRWISRHAAGWSRGLADLKAALELAAQAPDDRRSRARWESGGGAREG